MQDLAAEVRAVVREAEKVGYERGKNAALALVRLLLMQLTTHDVPVRGVRAGDNSTQRPGGTGDQVPRCNVREDS